MKVRVRWTYAYMKEQTFEAIVDVPTDDAVEACELAADAAVSIDNSELKPLLTTYPGDPCDAVEQLEIVSPDTPATIRAVPDGDPEFIDVEEAIAQADHDPPPVP